MLATSIAEPEVETYIADQIAVGNRETLLNQLGLDGGELQDLLSKFADFQCQLNPAQLKVLARSLPSLERASKSLRANSEDLTQLFLEESDVASDVVLFYFLGGDGDSGIGIGWPTH